MRIMLKLGRDGEPYILMISDKTGGRPEQQTDAELLEYFIRLAKERGVEVENETDMDSRDDYASIRLKKKKI